MSQLLINDIKQTIDVSEKEIEHIMTFFVSDTFKKKDFIIRENDKVEHMYFILSGLVKLSVMDNHANEHIISFAMDAWWETDYHAFYTQTRASQSLRCIENTRVLKLSYGGYHRLLQEVPKMTHFFLNKAVRGHISSQHRILSLMTLSAQGKYEHFLKYYPLLLQRIPKTTLALYLGVSRETLSRFFRSPSYCD
ncbi:MULTISPECIES: Crp/Fnr family transcriptional regulator [unclassified Sphingobacterium]|uniref:Crp/Fnr family transcriptional regulator n=1 Tax=unclassified Sphingobacterium TaxID=2609468 RepID=UPI0025E523BB|nr:MULTISPECIES: Crp/Fnr family transcriptional regulator [unclassified Sphingobacterium]